MHIEIAEVAIMVDKKSFRDKTYTESHENNNIGSIEKNCILIRYIVAQNVRIILKPEKRKK